MLIVGLLCLLHSANSQEYVPKDSTVTARTESVLMPLEHYSAIMYNNDRLFKLEKLIPEYKYIIDSLKHNDSLTVQHYKGKLKNKEYQKQLEELSKKQALGRVYELESLNNKNKKRLKILGIAVTVETVIIVVLVLK